MSAEHKQVLVVVEDEPDMILLIHSKLFVDHRLEILGDATSADEALELARSMHPGLIILDHAILGDTMGLQAAPALKQAAPNAKILLFTAFDLRAEAEAEPAIDAYLPKSEISQLLRVCQGLLGLPPNGGTAAQP